MLLVHWFLEVYFTCVAQGKNWLYLDRKSNNVSVTFKVSKTDNAFRYTGYKTHKKTKRIMKQNDALYVFQVNNSFECLQDSQ